MLIAAPLLATLGTAITVKGYEGRQYPTENKGKYVFHFPLLNEQALIDSFQKHLEEKGFKDCVVIGGASSNAFKLYKLL